MLRRPSSIPRTALLKSALAIVEEDGVGAVGLREVARRAGVSHGAPYRHFVNREALVAALAEDGFRALLDTCIDAEARAGADSLARFRALGIAYLSFALEHPGHFRVMFGTEATKQGEGVRSAEAAVFALAVNAIVAGQREDAIVEGDAQELAMLAWASVHGLANLMLDGLVGWVGLGEKKPEKLAKRLTSQLFEGLRPRRRER